MYKRQKQTFWCVSYYLIAFGTVWLPYETRCKTGRTSAKVRATKSRRNFSNEHTRSTPYYPKLTFWCVCTIWVHSDYLVPLRNSVQNGPNYCKSSCHEAASEFFATNAPNPPHCTLNRWFEAFCIICVHSGPFGCLTKLGAQRANKCKSSCHEVASEFFAMNTSDPPHWTLN